MLAALLLAGAVQAAVPTRFAWDYEPTHEGATFAIEWASTFASGAVPCTDAVLTPTVDIRCTGSLLREEDLSVRVRVSKDGASAYSQWIVAPRLGTGGSAPGQGTITFVGEVAALVATTASRRFDGIAGAHILAGVSGAAAGTDVGGQAQWAYAAWVQIAAAGDGGAICGIWSDSNYQALLMLNGDGSVTGLMHGSFFYTATSPPNRVTPGRWSLVALRHVGNGFSGLLSVWIDDAKVAEAATSGTAPVALVPFQIGAHGTQTAHLNPFTGSLSGVGVWRATAPSDADMHELRSRYPTTPPAGLTFLTIRGMRDEVVDYVGGMPLVNGGTNFSGEGPTGIQP